MRAEAVSVVEDDRRCAYAPVRNFESRCVSRHCRATRGRTLCELRTAKRIQLFRPESRLVLHARSLHDESFRRRQERGATLHAAPTNFD